MRTTRIGLLGFHRAASSQAVSAVARPVLSQGFSSRSACYFRTADHSGCGQPYRTGWHLATSPSHGGVRRRVSDVGVAIAHRNMSSLAEDWVRIPYPVSISQDGLRAETVLPGYKFGDINRAGHVDLWHSLRADESVRIRLLSESKMSVSSLLTHKLMFLLCQHCQYSPAFYQASNYFQPVQHTKQIVHIGRSSLHYSHTNRVVGSGDLLHQNHAQIVLVDKKTRRAVPFSNSVIENVRRNLQADAAGPMDRFEILTKPKPGNAVEQSTIQVQPSDMDYYMHTNQASYARFCLDVASRVAAKGRLNNFSKDMAFYRVKEFKCLHQGETNAGDQLTVSLWEDTERVLKFIVEKQDKSVFQCVIEFYDQEAMTAKF